MNGSSKNWDNLKTCVNIVKSKYNEYLKIIN